MNAKTLFGTVVLALVLSMGAIRLVLHSGPPKSSPAEAFAERPHMLEVLWPAPDFAFADQHGRTVTPKVLAGRPYVANFVFTQCRTVCPLLTAKMVQLQRQLAGVPVQFVSFSVDPAHDTPEVLLAYAKQWNAAEERWTLLSTGEATLQPLARGFHVTADKAQPTATQPDPIIHSAIFVLVDGEGMVRGAYDSEHRKDFEALARDARALAGSTTPAPSVATTPRSPEALYHELSCVACHERPELAPPLRGLLGQKRELSTGLLTTADEAYVRESILAPEARLVRGYPLKMPTYDGLLSGAELDALVAWIAARPAVEGADAGEVELHMDPVCHMDVRATPDALKAELDGGTWYFCAEVCRERFLKNPAAFGAARNASAPLDTPATRVK